MKKKPDPSGEEQITVHSDPEPGFWGSWKLFGRRKRDDRAMQGLYGPPEMLGGSPAPPEPDIPDESDKGEHTC